MTQIPILANGHETNPVYDQGKVVICVGNLAEEKSRVSISVLPATL